MSARLAVLSSDPRCAVCRAADRLTVARVVAMLPPDVDAVALLGEPAEEPFVEQMLPRVRLGGAGALVRTVPVTDALKLVASGMVERSLDRATITEARTPHVLGRGALESLPGETPLADAAVELARRGAVVEGA